MDRRSLIAATAALTLLCCAGSGRPTATVSGTSPEPSAPATAATSEGLGARLTSAEAQELVDEHARVRADVGVGPMRWSPKIAAFAQKWADELVADDCSFRHRTDGHYGENLFMGTTGAYSLADAVVEWESEKTHYDGGALTNRNWYDSGHYTQVIWRESTRLGCAKSECKADTIVVCNYDPPGNRIGDRPY